MAFAPHKYLPNEYVMTVQPVTDASVKALRARSRQFVPAVGDDRASVLILYACILENAFLAFVNNMLVRIDSQIVSSVQVVITMAAIGLVVHRRRKVSLPFVFGIIGFTFLSFLSAMYKGGLDLRFLYDVSIIPVFLLLGSTSQQQSISFLTRVLLIVFVVAIFEIALPNIYARVFNPGEYFYFTRDWMAAYVDYTGNMLTDLYLGSYRPGGSIFGASHRAGSVFLEPLSLGYFAVVASIFFVHAPGLARKRRAFLVSVCLFLAALSDTRVAVSLIVVLVTFSGILSRVPRQWLYMTPAILIVPIGALYIFPEFLGANAHERISITFGALENSSLGDLVFGSVSHAQVGDSGAIYFIGNAGILGYMLYLLLASGLFLANRPPVFESLAVLLYLFVTSLFGGAFLSIKTAALLGYTLGAISCIAPPSTRKVIQSDATSRNALV
jgi:putative polymerase